MRDTNVIDDTPPTAPIFLVDVYQAEKWLPIHEEMKGRYGTILTGDEILTLHQDAKTKKLAFWIECRECRTLHRRFSSDIKQTKAICPTCRGKMRKAGKKASDLGIPILDPTQV